MGTLERVRACARSSCDARTTWPQCHWRSTPRAPNKRLLLTTVRAQPGAGSTTQRPIWVDIELCWLCSHALCLASFLGNAVSIRALTRNWANICISVKSRSPKSDRLLSKNPSAKIQPGECSRPLSPRVSPVLRSPPTTFRPSSSPVMPSPI